MATWLVCLAAPCLLAGCFRQERALPVPAETGSSATPELLLERAIGDGLGAGFDIARTAREVAPLIEHAAPHSSQNKEMG